MSGSVWLDTDEWVIQAEPHILMRFRRAFPRATLERGKRVRLQATDEMSRDVEWFIDRFPMVCWDMAELEKGARGHDKRQALVEEFHSIDYKPPNVDLVIPLRPYQLSGVDFSHRRRRVLIGDDVGLGKTAIGIGLATKPDTTPVMVVCQSHMPKQWVAQIKKFCPELKTHIIRGRKPYKVPHADIYIVSYMKLIGWHPGAGGLYPRTVILDECQEVRRKQSSKHDACAMFSNAAQFCMGLSATPIFNFGNEAYNVIDVIDPDSLGSWEEFFREWGVDLQADGKCRIKNPKAFGSHIRQQGLFLRRTRKEVNIFLPPLQKLVEDIEYDNDELERIEPLAKMLAHRIFSGSFEERGQAARDLDLKLRQATGIAKAKQVAAYVKILLQGGEKVLLAGWHRAVYDIWMKELDEWNPVMFTGSESPAQKEVSRIRFTNGDSRVMLMSLRSGVGLDGLQDSCSVIVFGELDWSPAVHTQIEGRLFRFGQKRSVLAIYLVANGGSDPLMVELLGLKSTEQNAITDPDAPITEILDNQVAANRIKLLAQRVLDRSLTR